MNYTDSSVAGAEFTLYLMPAGVDLYGNPMYRFQDFCMVRLNDPTDSTGTFMLPLPWQHPLGDPFDATARFRFEMNDGPVPRPQPSDTDQKALHFVGPM